MSGKIDIKAVAMAFSAAGVSYHVLFKIFTNSLMAIIPSIVLGWLVLWGYIMSRKESAKDA